MHYRQIPFVALRPIRSIRLEAAARWAGLICIALLLPTSAWAGDDGQADEALFNTIAELDQAVFDAFNRCSAPEQLEKYASYFDEDLEFYHDEVGVTWQRKDMVDGTGQNACGRYVRELIEGSLKVYPIKDFGAIAQGVHCFRNVDAESCHGIADYVMIWRREADGWQITRALSFGHRPMETEEKAEPSK